MKYLEWLKPKKQKVEWWLSGAEGRENGELLFNGYGVSLLKD